MTKLTHLDFPIIAQGHNVYRRMESGPICTCADMDMASEIALRLNELEYPHLKRRLENVIAANVRSFNAPDSAPNS